MDTRCNVHDYLDITYKETLDLIRGGSVIVDVIFIRVCSFFSFILISWVLFLFTYAYVLAFAFSLSFIF